MIKIRSIETSAVLRILMDFFQATLQLVSCYPFTQESKWPVPAVHLTSKPEAIPLRQTLHVKPLIILFNPRIVNIHRDTLSAPAPAM
jgi:hypothetical protein